MKRGAGSLFAAVALSAFLFCSIAQSKERINVIYSSISGLFLGLWVAEETGLFEKEGLEVHLIYIQSAPVVLQAMLAGEAQIAAAGGKPVVDSGLEGGEAVLIGAIASVPAFYFMAAPGIRSVGDLRGKPVGVTRFGGSPDFAMRLVLKKYGLEPVRDVPIIQIGGGMPALAAALSKQAIYAATLSTPFNRDAEKSGAKVLIDMTKSGIFFPHSAIITTRAYLRQHRPVALAFLKAYAEGLKRMAADKALGIRVLKKYMRVEEPELLDATYDYSMNFIEKIPYPTKEGVAEILRQSTHPRAKSTTPESFMDESLVRELDQKGFLSSRLQK